VIWDGSPIHRAKVESPLGEAFLADGAAQRLWLEQLPEFAPDVNPVERIWHYLKRLRLGNICCRTLQ
jgi:putative transposase